MRYVTHRELALNFLLPPGAPKDLRKIQPNTYIREYVNVANVAHTADDMDFNYEDTSPMRVPILYYTSTI